MNSPAVTKRDAGVTDAERRATSRVARRCTVVAVTSLAFLGSGCGAAVRHGHTDARPLARAGSRFEAAGVRQPLTTADFVFIRHTGFMPGQEGVIQHALEAATRSCMLAHGFPYTEAPAYDGENSRNDDLTDVPGVAPSEASLLRYRRRNGYGLYQMFRAPAAGQLPNDRYVASLTSAAQTRWLVAFEGDRSQDASMSFPGGVVINYQRGGCQGRAQATVFGSVAAFTRRQYEPTIIYRELSDAAFASPQVRRAGRAWSACVARAVGTHFSSPGALQGALQRRYESTGATPATHRLEIRDAIADTTCAYGTGLARSYSAAFWDSTRRLPLPQQRDLTILVAQEAQAYSRAVSLLARHGV